MKTAFPDKDRNRYFMMDAAEYEERYAAPSAPVTAGTALLEPGTPEEENAIEQLGITIGMAVIEVFMGRRPVHHLSPWLSAACYRTISQQVTATQELLTRTFSPLTQPQKTPTATRISPRRIILQKVSPKAYEICLIVQDGSRARAIALRAEKSNYRWKICTIAVA